MNERAHIPVLLDEFLSFYKNLEIEVFVDGTLGAGGHSQALLKAHPEIKTLIGFDQDAEAIKIAKERLRPYEDKVEIIPLNFCDMQQELKSRKINSVDGIFIDIGVSSMQLDTPSRGFSFSKDGPLDMRMDQRCELTAEDVVNTWSEKELGELLRDYGDVSKWRQVAKTIVEKRAKKPFQTTQDLTLVLSPYLRKSSKKTINPMTLVFQALRIAVNNELKVLDYSLPLMVDMLRPGGRLGVISFHSGEDRIVKNIFRSLSHKEVKMDGEVRAPIIELITKKPITPTEQECDRNPRSRSAKMRFVEKL